MYLPIRSKEQGQRISDLFWATTTQQGADTWTTTHDINGRLFLHIPTDGGGMIPKFNVPSKLEIKEAFQEFMDADEMSDDCVDFIFQYIESHNYIIVFDCLPECLREKLMTNFDEVD